MKNFCSFKALLEMAGGGMHLPMDPLLLVIQFQELQYYRSGASKIMRKLQMQLNLE